MENNNQGSGEVEFNEALGVIGRLDKLQNQINQNFSNLTALNIDGCDYNYNLVFKDLNSMLAELSADLTPEELNLAVTNKTIIMKCLEEFPIIIKRKKNTDLIDIKRLELFEGALQRYRYLLNKFKKKHGFGNPEKKDVKKSIVNM